ncbi:transglutaminase-like domain-containing protein [Eubacteriales bacterium OttesenSCG-928-N13]|nr:transglutaminase-like domain-containing protein [Eubacteriales bacterium OttesenSCG-928-N13]
MERLIQSQVCPLPEQILKLKWAGDYDGAMRAIDARLKRASLPRMLRERLTMERELLSRLARQFPFDRQQALAQITEHIPDFTQQEFDALEDQGAIDFLFVDGQKRYFESAYPMLLEWDRAYVLRAGNVQPVPRPIIADAIHAIEGQGELGYRIRMRVEMHIDDTAFCAGQTYRVHLPIPKPCAQQGNIEIVADSDAYIAPEDAPQRTAFFERTLQQNAPFVVEYEYDHIAKHMQGSNRPIYPNEPAPTPDDLAEIAPHLVFTPYLRDLAQELRGDLTDDVQIARACYDFVTQQVCYSYLRDYLLHDNVAEYTATCLKGDCGAQVLLLMALLRINGIPSRWQSGTNARPDSTGSHDWMLIYLAPYGWVLCDPSRGGGLYQAGDAQDGAFYFGNMDPYRMVANSQYMAPFDPPKTYLRNDPYDNQSGECETLERALRPGEIRTERTLLKFEKL